VSEAVTKRVIGTPFQPGNPGRPKGARGKLGEAFTVALYQSFQEDGVTAINRVRDEEPAQYCKIIASLLPKIIDADEDLRDLLPAAISQVERARAIAFALRLGVEQKTIDVEEPTNGD
jgi:hypothetical protein